MADITERKDISLGQFARSDASFARLKWAASQLAISLAANGKEVVNLQDRTQDRLGDIEDVTVLLDEVEQAQLPAARFIVAQLYEAAYRDACDTSRIAATYPGGRVF